MSLWQYFVLIAFKEITARNMSLFNEQSDSTNQSDLKFCPFTCALRRCNQNILSTYNGSRVEQNEQRQHFLLQNAFFSVGAILLNRTKFSIAVGLRIIKVK